MNTAESAIRTDLPVSMLPPLPVRHAGEHSEIVSGKVDRVAAVLNIDRASRMEEARRESALEGIVGRSAALERAIQEVQVVAPTDGGVLILGETGTGKELIARANHNRSDRQNRPF